MAVVLGTAGHIDHGKTSLIQALTGINCDKLHEEKRRGITIELGFAYYDSPTGERLSIIDVPGHEKFIKHMVSGSSGIDILMLVIAADEGIMPQTREHLEICSLLGIQHGFIALTKIDMVTSEWLEIITEDIAGFLQDTFLANSPIIPVSSLTEEGVSSLKDYLNHQIKTVPPQKKTDVFRLAIDKIFTLKGHGTIATGTMTSGSISVGETLTVLPSGLTTKAKNLHCHGMSIKTAYPGQRIAINLHGVNISKTKRGDVLARPETIFPSNSWLISLYCLPSSQKILTHRTEVHFHHGTQDILARLYFFNKNKVFPGETALCEVIFNKSLIGIFGDHVVIRTGSPLQTVAGGLLLNPLGITSPRKKISQQTVDTLLSLPYLKEERLVQEQIELSKNNALYFSTLSVLTNLHSSRLAEILKDLLDKNKIVCFDQENQGYISTSTIQYLHNQCLLSAKAFHKKEPLKQGITRGILTTNTHGWGKGLPQKLTTFVVDSLLNIGSLLAIGNTICAASHNNSLGTEQQKLHDDILTLYIDAGFNPPSLQRTLDTLHLNFKNVGPIIKRLIEEGLLIKIKEDMYFSTQAIQTLRTALKEWFTTHKNLDLAEFKNISGGLSRKYIIPLLEYFDKERLTIRIGNSRQLRDINL